MNAELQLQRLGGVSLENREVVGGVSAIIGGQWIDILEPSFAAWACSSHDSRLKV